MSLDNSIKHGKEHRKPYAGAKAVHKPCRNHGWCDWCYGNRMYSTNKKIERMNYDIKEYMEDTEYNDCWTVE